MPKNIVKSAVVDTNIFVSGLILKKGLSYQLVNLLKKDSFVLILSKDLRTELEEVLRRIKFAKFLSEDKISRFFRMIDTIAIVVSPKFNLPVKIRDPKDEIVLAAALGGKADYLITGDQDLLVLKGNSKLGNLGIVTVSEFLALLRK